MNNELKYSETANLRYIIAVLIFSTKCYSMNNTNNIKQDLLNRQGRGRLLSQNFEADFVNTETWNLFKSRFKSETTEASYWSDINEFCRITGKPFDSVGQQDVSNYYQKMQEKVREGRISPLTLTKKFRELHSFAEFLIGQGEFKEKDTEDFFYPYLKNMVKEEKTARSVPVEDMDALFDAASEDIMAYTILTLMYRGGLTSTEIAGLNGEEDFMIYDDGIYVIPAQRREPCHIPEDAWAILKEYMEGREAHPSLFYNKRGGRLNTMYISRMMKKYCSRAGIRTYSSEAVRNSCAFNLFAYGATAGQTAAQMGRTELQIRRYKGISYRGNLRKKANDLVKMRIEKP